MRNGKSVADLRQLNRALLLENLYFGGPASRKRLSELTGLTAASVTQLTSQLISEGVLAETEKCPPQNRSGRAEQLLDLDRGSLRVIGVVAVEDGITLNLSDLDLNLLRTEKLPMKSEIFLNGRLLSAIESLSENGAQSVVGIGVSVRGIVDPLRGVSVDSYGLLPRDFPIASPLSEASGLPVTADNNVRAMLTAHTLLSPDSSRGSELFIKYGPGIGGALMIDGKHFLGSRFSACELGHICAEDGGRPCVCGKRGCLETLLRYDALLRRAETCFSLERTPALYSLCGGRADNITTDSIFSAFSKSDPGVRDMLRTPLASFAVAVASCVAMYDPDAILLCSEMFEHAALAATLETEIKKRVGNSCPRLCFLTNRGELGIKSAAATAVKAFLHSGATNFKKTNN